MLYVKWCYETHIWTCYWNGVSVLVFFMAYENPSRTSQPAIPSSSRRRAARMITSRPKRCSSRHCLTLGLAEGVVELMCLILGTNYRNTSCMYIDTEYHMYGVVFFPWCGVLCVCVSRWGFPQTRVDSNRPSGSKSPEVPGTTYPLVNSQLWKVDFTIKDGNFP